MGPSVHQLQFIVGANGEIAFDCSLINAVESLALQVL